MSSYSLLKLLPFSPSVLKPLTIDGDPQPTPVTFPLGGFFYDSKYAWLATGSVLQIVSTTSQSKISEWLFGSILKDHTIRITCVVEIPRKLGGLPLLAVGLQSNIVGGLICFFDVAVSKVIRTIDVKYNVSKLIFVETENNSAPLPGCLRTFDGVLAVGLNGGDVLLIDLCWQILDEVLAGGANVTDELNPCEIVILLNKDIHKVEYYKEKSIRKGFHLAIHLNYVDKDPSQHFKLKAPTGETIVLVNSVEVAVSALHYCPQLGSILVGYNFGALQLWDIMDMKLVYTSPVYEKNMPVSHFAVQEPSDDPKAFCYIWAIYSNTEPFIDDFPVAALYSFTYTTKEYHEDYGYLYEGFVSCRVRFQMDLMLPDDYVPTRKPKGGWCVGLEALNKNRNTALMELPEDNLVISCFMWTVWCSSTEAYTYQAVFDLNQWYKEQMPGDPQWDECSSYLMYKRVSELYQKENKENGVVLATVTKLSSISQFMGVQRLEEHYHPSSLSFEFNILRDKDCSLIVVKGVQKTLLQQLQSTGPLALIQPSKLYQDAVRLGLSPLFTDVPSDNSSITENDQRKLLLNIAIEQQMLNWLCGCAKEWANGSFSFASCTLDMLISWAWDRAVVLKNNADNLCVSLFDYSGLKLDANSQKIVNCCCRQLANLHVFYTFVLDKLKSFLYDIDFVQLQCNKLYMVSTYFEVLQWLINVKLLPEYLDVNDAVNNGDFVPYPVEIITNYYNKRREDLSELSEKRFREKCNLLFIDNLIETYCGGSDLEKQWEDEEDTNGSYPPPSLQALLRTYLVENAEISHKHSLIIYVFLDLAMVLNQDRYTETITQLIKFPAVFKLSQSLIKITQAFWQLDHEDFSTALEHLLDPLVLDSDLKLWHHRIVLKALLVQEQYNYGLLYLKTRNPPLVNDDDFKLAISFYIANTMVDNALYLLRKNGFNKPNDKLLMHLFGECVRFEKTREVLNYPLTLEEETAFFTYMEDINHPYAQDIRVFYNIVRSRFLDAYELNTRSHLKKFSTDVASSEENARFRDSIIGAYKKLMPEVSQKLLNACQKERAHGFWKEVPKPLPMSVFIHDTNEQVKYKSTIVNASLSKAIDTWNNPVLHDKYCDFIKTEDTPFLRTPKVDLKEKRKMTPIVIEPSIVTTDMTDEGPSPPKRAKLGSISESYMKRFDTPVVKRKSSRLSSRASLDGINVCTPQSILKVGNLVRRLDEIATSRGESTTPEDLNVCESENENVEKSAKKKRFSFGLTPRRPVSRLDNHTVRFTDLTTPSTTTNTTDSQRRSDSLQEDSSKTTSAEESFHSVESVLITPSPDSKLDEMEQQLREIEEDESENERTDNKEAEKTFSVTPRRRRSLRSTVSPVRQSPRLSKRISSDTNSNLSSPQESSTPLTSPKRALPTKRMSLQQKVLTYNALKALTPKSRTSETSYSKVDTVTTKITTAERIEESVVTSIEEKVDVVREEGAEKKHEHKESSKVTSEKSVCDYSDNDIVFEMSSPYEGLDLTDSIFESDAEEVKNTNVTEDQVLQIEENVETKTENEKDPLFNIYESSHEPSPSQIEDATETDTVLTEMPIMTAEQYSAMEEDTFDELHEEYFDEEVIVQEYLSPTAKTSLIQDEPERTEPTVLSEVIEIDDSSSGGSVSEKENANLEESNDSSSYSSSGTSSSSKVKSASSRSDSDSESNSSSAKGGVDYVEEEEVVREDVRSNESDNSKEEQNSSTSKSDQPYDAIFEEDTQELPTKNVEYSEAPKEVATDFGEYLHLPEAPVYDVVEAKTQETENVLEKKTSRTSSETTEQYVESSTSSNKLEILEEARLSPANEEQVPDNKLLTTKEDKIVVQEIEVVFEQNQEVLEPASNEREYKTENQFKSIAERELSIKIQDITNVDNQPKSDLDFSVISEQSMSKSLATTFHRTDLSFSVIETPNQTHITKSDLDFSLASDEASVHVFTTTSTPHVKKPASDEESEKQLSTSRTRRSKSVELMVTTPEPSERRILRKRSASVEITDTKSEKPKSRRRNVPVQLPAIQEEDKEANTKATKRKRQPKEVQSASGVLEQRRVTRRQKDLLEKAAMQNEDSSGNEDEERGPALDPIDPLQLLHKSSFKGKPDPEEARMRKKSPSSISRSSSKSELHSISDANVSTRKSFTKAKTISPPHLTIKTRSRTKSCDSPKMETTRKTRSSSRKGDDDTESVISEVSTRSRRSRAASVSSVKSDSAAVNKKNKPRSGMTQKSLTKITEESTDAGAKPSKRVTRSTSSKN